MEEMDAKGKAEAACPRGMELMVEEGLTGILGASSHRPT